MSEHVHVEDGRNTFNGPIRTSVPPSSYMPQVSSAQAYFTIPYVCPDVFGLKNIGAADNARGRFIRAFFWILDRVWPA